MFIFTDGEYNYYEYLNADGSVRKARNRVNTNKQGKRHKKFSNEIIKKIKSEKQLGISKKRIATNNGISTYHVNYILQNY